MEKFKRFYNLPILNNNKINDFNIEVITKELALFHLHFEKLITVEEYCEVTKNIRMRHDNCEIKIRLKHTQKAVEVNQQLLVDYFIWLKNADNKMKLIFNCESVDCKDGELIFVVTTNFAKRLIEEKIDIAQKFYESIGISDLKFKVIIDESLEEALAAKKEFAERQKAMEESAYIASFRSIAKSSENSNNQNFKYQKKQIDLASFVEKELHELNEDYDNNKNFIVKGQVFGHSVQSGISKKNQRPYEKISFYITNNRASVHINAFINKSNEYLRDVKDNKSVEIHGKYSFNEFSQKFEISPVKVEFIEDLMLNEKNDNAENKRIELHAHTKYSKMNATLNINEYVQAAKEMGHTALAITDHDSVQGYIDFAKETKAAKIKPLYGLEISMTRSRKAINSFSENDLIKQVYTVFDVETTGLSANYAKIIEIGAVKVRDGQIIDRLQTFVNISEPLHEFTKRLTNIDDYHLENAPQIQEALKRFDEFAKDTILVAHNAEFDMAFMRRHFKMALNQDFEYEYLDTLELARFLLKEERNLFGLKNIATHYKIKFPQGSHHRADFDSEKTAEILIAMIHDLKKRHNIVTIKELYNAENMTLNRGHHIMMFAKNQEGLKDLFYHLSNANTKNFARVPRLFEDELNQRRDNLLIGAAGCSQGEVFNAAINDSDENLKKVIAKYDYIEVMTPEQFTPYLKTGGLTQEQVESILTKIIDFATELNKIVVAVGNVHHLNQEDGYLKEILISSTYKADKTKTLEDGSMIYYDRERFKNIRKENRDKFNDQYYKNTSEMKSAFAFLNNEELIEAIVCDNPQKIANMLADDIQIIHDKLYTPKIDGVDQKIKTMVMEKAYQMYGNPLPEIISLRIKKELDSILGYGFGVIYYISAKLVNYSLANNYLVGSRGSVGSSLVATLMGITEVNPMPPHYTCPDCQYSKFYEDGSYHSGYDLPKETCPNCNAELHREGQDIPFETFLGFKGDKVPDIDLNFSGEFQAEAHEFVRSKNKLNDPELFDEHHAFRAGTISTLAGKTSFGFVKGYYELIDEYISYADTVRVSNKLEGVKRTTGQHPGGIIVVPNGHEIYEFTPIQYPADKPDSPWCTTHFDFHSIHDNLLKLDILGHDDPTILKKLYDLTKVDPKTIDVADPNVLELFVSTKSLNLKPGHELIYDIATLGVPEFGTKFVIEMLKDTKPTKFSELVQISGLSHGTSVWRGNAQELVKKGKIQLEDVIGCRDDIMVYLMHKGIGAEDSFRIMENVRRGKGLTLEEETLLRNKNIEEWYIESCQKIKYMFPKAHAVAYVIMALRVAYYKVYYPLEYYAAYFSSRVQDFEIDTMMKDFMAIHARIEEINHLASEYTSEDKKEKIMVTLNMTLEMSGRGFKILPFDLNRSMAKEFIIDYEAKGIIPPWSTIDGLGDNVALKIIEEREKEPFADLEDFKKRSKVNKTVLEKMHLLGVLKNL